jgi:ubiquinone/menaquinone biosynthesis C-methylase UbiE
VKSPVRFTIPILNDFESSYELLDVILSFTPRIENLRSYRQPACLKESIELGILPKGLATSGAVEVRSKLSFISGGKVLDVATGPGDYIQTMMKALKNYESLVGIDILKEDLETAKKKFKNQPIELMEMNAESMEFDDDSFDTVSMAYSLHHLDRIDTVLVEMVRVLKPGGTLIIQEEFRDGNQTEAQKTNFLQHAWDAEIDSLLGQTHKATFTKQEIKGFLDHLQLEKVEMFESTWPVECLFCEDMFNCEDPKSETAITSSIKEIDENIQRLKKITDLTARMKLQEKGEKLKERNRKFGNAHPSVLLIIAKNPS